jgi:hypothetical protein
MNHQPEPVRDTPARSATANILVLAFGVFALSVLLCLV